MYSILQICGVRKKKIKEYHKNVYKTSTQKDVWIKLVKGKHIFTTVPFENKSYISKSHISSRPWTKSHNILSLSV